jgi:Protein kinase domain
VSTPANSSSSAEGSQAVRAFESVRPGDVIAGFRVERLIGRGETGVVYEAVPLSLDRHVALRLIDPARYPGPEARARLDRELGLASSLHHPGLVPLFESGEWDGGRFVAMRLIRGGNLGSLRPAGAPAENELLRPVSAGLEAAHAAGLTHGAVRARNVLIDRDGRAFLADLGLGRGAGAAADGEGLAEVWRRVDAPKTGRRPRALLLAVGVGVAIVACVIALIASRSGDESSDADAPAPAAPEGTVALGSALSPGPADRIGCGSGFGGGSACVLVPADGDGEPLRATEPGVIREWAVREATGVMTLHVLRPRGARTSVIGFSQPAEASDAGPHSFPAEIRIDRGDLIAVELAPRAALGRRPGGGGALRWASTVQPPPALSEATPLEGELLVRVDVEPGAELPQPEQLTGQRAQAAPEGTPLAEARVAVTSSDAVQVRLVRVDDRIQLDAFRGPDRTARFPLTDVDPEGDLILLEQSCGYPRSVCLRWRNRGAATPLVHVWSVAPSGRFRVIG